MRFILVIFLTFFASLSAAEPSSEVQTLMDRKLSIFDWGMFELKQRLVNNGIDASVTYNWDENEVKIMVYNLEISSRKTMEQTKSDCEEVFKKNDEVLWIRNGADKLKDICIFCAHFQHNGWTYDDIKDAQEKLKNRLYYFYSDSYHSCTRKAYGTSIAVSSYN